MFTNSKNSRKSDNFKKQKGKKKGKKTNGGSFTSGFRYCEATIREMKLGWSGDKLQPPIKKRSPS